jgi:hypothetical protein
MLGWSICIYGPEESKVNCFLIRTTFVYSQNSFELNFYLIFLSEQRGERWSKRNSKT